MVNASYRAAALSVGVPVVGIEEPSSTRRLLMPMTMVAGVCMHLCDAAVFDSGHHFVDGDWRFADVETLFFRQDQERVSRDASENRIGERRRRQEVSLTNMMFMPPISSMNWCWWESRNNTCEKSSRRVLACSVIGERAGVVRARLHAAHRPRAWCDRRRC